MPHPCVGHFGYTTGLDLPGTNNKGMANRGFLLATIVKHGKTLASYQAQPGTN